MSRFILSLLLMLSFLSQNACAAQQQEAANDTAAALIKHYPQIKYQQINPSPVTGVYEVIVENGEIIYFVPASGHMFFGELWTDGGHNLTRESKSQLMSAKLKEFPLDQAIKIGEGPNQVIEVTDPDCPFCRQSSDFFLGRDDVTRYIFLSPIDQLHPHAADKARYILSAADPEQAYEEVFSGQFDQQPLPPFTDNGRLELQRQIAKRIGIHGTPQFWINGQHVAGFNPQQFETLLNK